MSKLKVAFFADMLLRDYDGCMRTIFHILDRKPEEVQIQYYTGSQSSIDEVINIPDLVIPFNDSYKFVVPALGKKEAVASLDEFKPDIIHISNPSLLGRFAAGYAKKNGIKVSSIYHTHFLSYVDFYMRKAKFLIPIADKLMERQMSTFYSMCDMIFVPTKIMIEELNAIGINRHNMQLWARGLDKDIFNPDQRNIELLHKSTGNLKPNVLFASRLVWEKNLETLIKIQEVNASNGLPFNLIVAGEGVAKRELERRMPGAYFIGNLTQKELATYYASSEVFLFPSISETYGNVVMESMACGTPCVVGNGGGSASLIDEAKTGYKIEPYNPQQYFDFCMRLIQDKTLRAELSANGLEKAKDHNWDRLVSIFYGLLQDLKEGTQPVA